MMAEERGFEPPVRFRTIDFESITLSHSDTPPYLISLYFSIFFVCSVFFTPHTFLYLLISCYIIRDTILSALRYDHFATPPYEFVPPGILSEVEVYYNRARSFRCRAYYSGRPGGVRPTGPECSGRPGGVRPSATGLFSGSFPIRRQTLTGSGLYL